MRHTDGMPEWWRDISERLDLLAILIFGGLAVVALVRGGDQRMFVLSCLAAAAGVVGVVLLVGLLG
jgi:hypothetical protein